MVGAYAVAAVLAVALLAFVFGPHTIGDYFTESDFYGAYADGARLVEHGHLVPARYGVIGPGYEVALGLAGFLVRDLFLAAQLLSVLASVTTVILWFHLLRRRLDARVGLLAALFMAINGWFFRFGYAATTDALAVALQGAALYLLLARTGPPGPEPARAARGRGAPDQLATASVEAPAGRSLARGSLMLAAGAVSALAFLTRYNALYLLPAGLVAIAGGAVATRHRTHASLLFAIGFFVPVVPWVIYSLAHGGGFSFQLHHNIAYEVFARSKGIAWDDYQKLLQPQFPTLWSVIARDPAAVFGHMLFNVVAHLRQDVVQLLGWPTAVAAAAGIALGLSDASLRRLWPVFVAGGLLFLTLVPVFYSERYSLALLPLYATLAGVAFGSPLLAVAVGRERRVWLKPLLAIVPLAFALHASWKQQARALDQLPVEVRPCAATLERLAARGDRVIARKGHIGYHAGVEVVGFPFANDLRALADYARSAKARWLFVSWPEAETRPQFYFLLDTTAVVPGLTPRCVTRPHPAVLYEIGPAFGETPPWFANDTLRTWHMTRGQLLVDATDPKLLFRFAALSWSLGRLQPAREALVEAARFAPRQPDVFVLLGHVLIEDGDDAGAEQAFARAEELAPSDPQGRLGRGLAVMLSGRAREAAELWRPVIDAADPSILERMIALYESLGDRAAADQARAALARQRGKP